MSLQSNQRTSAIHGCTSNQTKLSRNLSISDKLNEVVIVYKMKTNMAKSKLTEHFHVSVFWFSPLPTGVQEVTRSCVHNPCKESWEAGIKWIGPQSTQKKRKKKGFFVVT